MRGELQKLPTIILLTLSVANKVIKSKMPATRLAFNFDYCANK